MWAFSDLIFVDDSPTASPYRKSNTSSPQIVIVLDEEDPNCRPKKNARVEREIIEPFSDDDEVVFIAAPTRSSPREKFPDEAIVSESKSSEDMVLVIDDDDCFHEETRLLSSSQPKHLNSRDAPQIIGATVLKEAPSDVSLKVRGLVEFPSGVNRQTSVEQLETRPQSFLELLQRKYDRKFDGPECSSSTSTLPKRMPLAPQLLRRSSSNCLDVLYEQGSAPVKLPGLPDELKHFKKLILAGIFEQGDPSSCAHAAEFLASASNVTFHAPLHREVAEVPSTLQRANVFDRLPEGGFSIKAQTILDAVKKAETSLGVFRIPAFVYVGTLLR
jgi:hypothetical protein